VEHEGPECPACGEDVRIVGSQCLRENIGKLLIGGDIEGTEITRSNFIADIMAIYFNVLGSFVKNWILGDMKSGLTITVKQHGLCMRKTETREDGIYPL